jgi:hypothetical protein
MAKKRYVSQQMTLSSDMNSLSDFEERVWLRLFINTDDYGLLPGDYKKLFEMTHFKEAREKDFIEAVNLLVKKELLFDGSYNGKVYLFFTPETFDEIQTNLTHRTKSEFSKIKAKSRKEFDLEFSSGNFQNKYPAKDKDKDKDNSGEGMQGEPKSTPESDSEKCFRLILEVRSTAEEPGKLTEFERRQIRGYASQYGEKVLKAIERLAKIGWRCTPDQIEKVIQGKLNPETLHEKTNGKAPVTPIRKELKAPAPKEEPKKDIASPDEVAKILGETGMKFMSGILPNEALPKRKGLKPLEELLPTEEKI